MAALSLFTRIAGGRIRRTICVAACIMLGTALTTTNAVAAPPGPTVQNQRLDLTYERGTTTAVLNELGTNDGSLTYTVEQCDPSSHPSVTVALNGTAAVSANRGVPITLSCTFHATDSLGQPSNTATLVVTVGFPAHPTVQDLNLTLPYSTTSVRLFDLSTGSNDPAGGGLSITVDSCTPTSHPSVPITSDGKGQIHQNVPIDLSCTLHATDVFDQPSNTGTLHIVVAMPAMPSVQDVHVVLPQLAGHHDILLNGLLMNSNDPAAGGLTAAVDSCQPASHPTVVFNGADIDIGQGMTVALSCTFHATDKFGRQANGVVTVVVGTPPAVVDHKVPVTQGKATIFANLLATGATSPTPPDFTFTLGPCDHAGVTASARGDLTVDLTGDPFLGTITCSFYAVDQAAHVQTLPAQILIGVNPPIVRDLSVPQAVNTLNTYPGLLDASGTASRSGFSFVLGTCTAADPNVAASAVTLTSAADGDIKIDLRGTNFVGTITCPISGTEGSRTDHATLTVTVNGIKTTTTLSASTTTPLLGQPVTFTATVTAASVVGALAGTVQFVDGGTVLGTSPITASGVATLTSTTLPGGTHQVRAVYSATAPYEGSTSNTVTLQVATCATGLTAHVLTASTSRGALNGLFCVDPSTGKGSYTQAPFGGAGTVQGDGIVVQRSGVTIIVAYGIHLQLTGQIVRGHNALLETRPVSAVGTFALT